MDSVRVRRMTERELAHVLEWADEEGWNPGLADAECFYAADPSGFFLAELAGEPVGSISAVTYGRRYGFLGPYLVRPHLRGRGIGRQLWQAGVGYLRQRTVGLDGVPAQQPNYRRSGFRLSHGNVRFRALTPSVGDTSVDVVDAGEVQFEAIAEFDAGVFAAPREPFLRRWLHQPGAAALAVEGAGGLSGYGVLRPCREGFKIGPLFAVEEQTAGAVFDALTAHGRGQPVYIDVPESNRAAMALAESRGLEPVFHTARMYAGKGAAPGMERVFGVTSLELG